MLDKPRPTVWKDFTNRKMVKPILEEVTLDGGGGILEGGVYIFDCLQGGVYIGGGVIMETIQYVICNELHES